LGAIDPMLGVYVYVGKFNVFTYKLLNSILTLDVQDGLLLTFVDIENLREDYAGSVLNCAMFAESKLASIRQ
jgi:hypothetical protein